jgi:hypothetical protein
MAVTGAMFFAHGRITAGDCLLPVVWRARVDPEVCSARFFSRSSCLVLEDLLTEAWPCENGRFFDLMQRFCSCKRLLKSFERMLFSCR